MQCLVPQGLLLYVRVNHKVYSCMYVSRMLQLCFSNKFYPIQNTFCHFTKYITAVIVKTDISACVWRVSQDLQASFSGQLEYLCTCIFMTLNTAFLPVSIYMPVSIMNNIFVPAIL